MEEQFLFTRVHEALDIPTPPGAYERLRTQLTRKPVRAFRRPALQMRTSTMGFRLAAGLLVVAIAVAAAAAALAIHNATNNVAPAGSRMSIAAYQRMISIDFANAAATYSAPCGSPDNSGCGADATRGIPAVQQWIQDVSRRDIPLRFVVINAEMRQVLLQNLSAQQDLLEASKAHDNAGMDRALWVASYLPDWMSTLVSAVMASQQVDAATYIRLVASETRTLDACGAACGFGGSAAKCASDGALTCQFIFDSALAPAFNGYAEDLVKEAAPPSLSGKDARLQADLARASGVLLTLRLAAAANDEIGFNSGIAELAVIRANIDADAAKITG